MTTSKESKEYPAEKRVLAIVGMPGAGKSETVAYIRQKGIPSVRFGDLTDEEIATLGLPLTPENERIVRERLRREYGMAVYAEKAKPKVDTHLSLRGTVAIDGLYSWEEYLFLQNAYPNLTLIHVFAERRVRYERLSKRPVRPLMLEECFLRDVAELERLNKGGPIAMANYLIENSSNDLTTLRRHIDILLNRLGIPVSHD